jgi:hypothetical protein
VKFLPILNDEKMIMMKTIEGERAETDTRVFNGIRLEILNCFDDLK